MLAFLTIAEAARKLRSGEVRAVELANAALRQIDALELAVRAWVVVDRDGALQAAQAADDALRRGVDRGPLHGIPVGIKDIIDVAGLPTLAGARVRTTEPAIRDARVTARLRSAGAVILGKTVTTEFASFDPPPTRNPWNAERTPGGSSSGSAAAVAVGMCAAALGSQTGGSIIRPAAYCGVCGMKPTWGRLSLAGIVPLSFQLDHPGPMARSVADLEIVYRALAAFDVDDPCSQRRDEMEVDPSRRTAAPRVGLVGGFFHERADDDVRRNTAAVVERLRQSGATVENVELPPSFAGVVAAHRLVMAVGAAAYHRETFAARRTEYGPRIASLLDEGLATTATDYARALELQLRFRRDMERLFDDTRLDALLMPSVSNPAPPADTTGDPSFQAPWSFAGLPVVTMPSGLSNDGLPTAVQCVGQAWRELPLLATAAWCEGAIAFNERPAILR
jgi:Asp-tRNA(Asn)/Glu-tRNA(Gln) amidotransferase A subunit family amidase